MRKNSFYVLRNKKTRRYYHPSWRGTKSTSNMIKAEKYPDYETAERAKKILELTDQWEAVCVICKIVREVTQ